MCLALLWCLLLLLLGRAVGLRGDGLLGELAQVGLAHRAQVLRLAQLARRPLEGVPVGGAHVLGAAMVLAAAAAAAAAVLGRLAAVLGLGAPRLLLLLLLLLLTPPLLLLLPLLL